MRKEVLCFLYDRLQVKLRVGLRKAPKVLSRLPTGSRSPSTATQPPAQTQTHLNLPDKHKPSGNRKNLQTFQISKKGVLP